MQSNYFIVLRIVLQSKITLLKINVQALEPAGCLTFLKHSTNNKLIQGNTYAFKLYWIISLRREIRSQ